MGQPLVSICIPAYNCEKYVGDTLCSLCSQQYANIELIVVNDGSTDDTLTQINAIDDKRLKVITTANNGAARARNRAFENANGSLIVFFDADDLVPPDFISTQVAVAEAHQHSVVLSAWGRFYGDSPGSGSIIPNPPAPMVFSDWIKEYWNHCNPMTMPGRAMIPLGILAAAGLWNEKLSLNDDLEFFTRIFLKCDGIVFNDSAAVSYRSGINGLSKMTGEDARRSLYHSIEISTTLVIERFGEDAEVRKGCANMWQSFIYEVYPGERDLRKKAAAAITKLAKPDYPFPAGGLTLKLVSLFGWKLAKLIKLLMMQRKIFRND